MKQSGVHIEIGSTLGAGTETALVVDDEKEIQEHAAALRGEIAYQAITASSADEAAMLLERCDEIDLLFTDVILPDAISCMGLAALARVRHPDLRVLFTSGCTENAVSNRGSCSNTSSAAPPSVFCSSASIRAASSTSEARAILTSTAS